MFRLVLVGLFSLSALTAHAQARAAWMHNTPVAATTAAAPDPEPSGVREVTVTSTDVTRVTTKLRYTTVIELPKNDPIVSRYCGDPVFWTVPFKDHRVFVKPSAPGKDTNLNLVTASGAIYSFLLREGGPDGKPVAVPDIHVIVTPAEQAAAGPDTPARRYYSSEDYETLQTALAAAREQAAEDRRRAEEEIATFKRDFPSTLHFNYGAWKNEKPFLVQAIWNDGQFTYIRSAARELPNLYEMLDGKPAVLNYRVENGMYVVPKVLSRGYLALGDKRFDFAEQD